MNKRYKEYIVNQWMGDFSHRYKAPEMVSEKTRIMKNKIVMDPILEESAKLIKLCELCMNSRETFYIHVLKGCVRFQCIDESVEVHCAPERIEKFADNRHVYHFDERRDEVFRVLNDKTLFGRKLCLDKRSFENRHFRILPVNPDLPYDSLVCDGYLEDYFGTGSYNEFITGMFIRKFGRDRSVTAGNHEFIKMCSQLNAHYSVRGAYYYSELCEINAVNNMRKQVVDKDDTFSYTDETSVFYPRILDLYEHRDLYKQLNLVSDDFFLSDIKSQATYIFNAYQLLKAANYKGSEYSYIYEKMKIVYGNTASKSEKTTALQEIIEELYYKNIIDLYYEHLSFGHNGKPGDPNNFENRLKRIPEDIRQRNDRYIRSITGKYGSLFENNAYKQIKDYERDLFFNYIHTKIYRELPKGADMAMKEQKALYNKKTLMEEYAWDKKLRERDALISRYA